MRKKGLRLRERAFFREAEVEWGKGEDTEILKKGLESIGLDPSIVDKVRKSRI